MRAKSAEILESWRVKAREESEYDFYPARIITGVPDVELIKLDLLQGDYRVLVLEG